MSAIKAHNDDGFTGNDYPSDLPVTATKAIPLPFNSSDLDISSVSATTVMGYLLALVSGAVLLLTGQPPWFLLTAVVALGVTFFLPRGLDITLSK